MAIAIIAQGHGKEWRSFSTYGLTCPCVARARNREKAWGSKSGITSWAMHGYAIPAGNGSIDDSMMIALWTQ